MENKGGFLNSTPGLVFETQNGGKQGGILREAETIDLSVPTWEKISAGSGMFALSCCRHSRTKFMNTNRDEYDTQVVSVVKLESTKPVFSVQMSAPEVVKLFRKTESSIFLLKV